MKNRIKITICLFSSALLIYLDRLSKTWADVHVAGKGMIQVVENYVILVYAKNRGAFLGFGDSLGDVLWFCLFVVLPIIFILAATIYVYKKFMNDRSILLLWILFFSGGAANVIDRILYGRVTDFMNIGIGQFLRSGIFNVADLYIVAAIAVLAIKSFPRKKNI